MSILKYSTIALGLALGATVLLAAHSSRPDSSSDESMVLTEQQRPQEAQFIRTASPAAFETDFTVAAEKTVNEVVCIKSFTSRRQQNYGGYDPFGMFDFFFG
ncbi:MAG: hypothetical protein K2J05_04480, partial [Muribaculaceae bacterium]|nr:hypothetical protein [Muribaculaceae bacterium]